MKEKFKMEYAPECRITLDSNGLTPAGRFFIVLSLVFIGFVSYAIFAYATYFIPSINSLSAFFIMTLVLLSSIIMFLVAFSLSYEHQEISVSNNKLTIKKNRPLWPDVSRTIDFDSVDGFAMEKLAFNFMNVWYAFIFHKDFGADEVENFVSPQVRMAGQTISFLEYADEASKRKALEGLKNAFKLA